MFIGGLILKTSQFIFPGSSCRDSIGGSGGGDDDNDAAADDDDADDDDRFPKF